MEMIRDPSRTHGKNLTFLQPNEGTVREDLPQVFSILKFISITDPLGEGRDHSSLMANVKM